MNTEREGPGMDMNGQEGCSHRWFFQRAGESISKCLKTSESKARGLGRSERNTVATEAGVPLRGHRNRARRAQGQSQGFKDHNRDWGFMKSEIRCETEPGVDVYVFFALGKLA